MTVKQFRELRIGDTVCPQRGKYKNEPCKVIDSIRGPNKDGRIYADYINTSLSDKREGGKYVDFLMSYRSYEFVGRKIEPIMRKQRKYFKPW